MRALPSNMKRGAKRRARNLIRYCVNLKPGRGNIVTTIAATDIKKRIGAEARGFREAGTYCT